MTRSVRSTKIGNSSADRIDVEHGPARYPALAGPIFFRNRNTQNRAPCLSLALTPLRIGPVLHAWRSRLGPLQPLRQMLTTRQAQATAAHVGVFRPSALARQRSAATRYRCSIVTELGPARQFCACFCAGFITDSWPEGYVPHPNSPRPGDRRGALFPENAEPECRCGVRDFGPAQRRTVHGRRAIHGLHERAGRPCLQFRERSAPSATAGLRCNYCIPQRIARANLAAIACHPKCGPQ